MPVGRYGCETWSFTLREECRLRILENRILRLIFGSNRDEHGEWRRLHVRNLIVYIIHLIKYQRLRLAGQVARMKEGRCAFKILTGKPTEKKGRPRNRWEDNIRMDLKEIGVNARNWVDSTQDRDYWRALVNEALNLRVT